MIKAIETEYNGYRFRSRLEARWAVFFDSVGAKYLYEPEGFVLQDGTYYLPDFYLPDIRTFVEVKGVMSKKDLHKIEEFAKDLESDQRIVIVGDIPGEWDAADLWEYGYDKHGERFTAYFHNGVDFPYLPCICPVCGKFGFEFDGRGARVCRDKCLPGSDKGYSYDHSKIIEGLRAARKARFEHGETPVLTGLR